MNKMHSLWWSDPMTTGRLGIGETIKRGVLAGAAGGLAEILWVSLYATITGGNAATLSRGVTTAVGVTALLPAASAAMGVAVHMVLAVLLGVAVACLWQAVARRQGVSSGYAVVIAALAAVWVMNFFVLLPAISPAFVHMVPYGVSLTSKLLFGLAAAETLRRFAIADAARMLTATTTVWTVAKLRHPAD
jgi:hypothetical protein